MKILVTNDDGINAIGLKLLVEKLQKYANEIYVVAPSSEKSATSHSLTIKDGLSYQEMPDIVNGVKTYALNGTPADCVNFAIQAMKLDFDYVFSGINNGYNIGNDIIYSGTFAAAQEAVMRGKKGVAISFQRNSTLGIKFFDKIMNYIISKGLFDEKAVININICENAKDIKITKQGTSTYITKYIEDENNIYYAHFDNSFPRKEEINVDIEAINEGYISVSLLVINYTDEKLFKKYH